MHDTAIFWPAIVQAFLIFALYLLLSKRRVAAVRARRATVKQFRENLSEPEDSLFVHNSLQNQFELPVLFFVVVLALHQTGGDNPVAVGLAWFFAISRLAHAYEHVTENRVIRRRTMFMAGVGAVIALWSWLGIHLVIG